MTDSKKQIAIVLYPGFTALDALGPYEFLKMLPDVEIRFVAAKRGSVVTDRGILVVNATHSFDETPSPYMLLIPGSEACTAKAMADPTLISWIQTAHQSSSYTTSVCSGALVLAAAGLLKGLPATSHWAAMSTLAKFGAIAKPDERIVQSGKIWTAAGVSAGLDLALHLIAEIAGTLQAEIAQLIIEYDPQPVFASGHMSKASDIVKQQAIKQMSYLSQHPHPVIEQTDGFQQTEQQEYLNE
jgi:transcriptional regulator GlxA family with amidase domain